jgi:hypothetical protein
MYQSNGDTLSREWRHVVERHKEEAALSAVSVRASSLNEALTEWMDVHTRQVAAGSSCSSGTLLPIDYGLMAELMNRLAYIIAA